MKYRNLILINTIVIILGVCIFALDAWAFDHAYNRTLLLMFAMAKTVFFMYYGYKNLLRFAKIDLSYHKFLLFISLNILMIIFSFSVDFFCLYQIDRDSFIGISSHAGMTEKGFDFFYFSFLIFSNIGMATILPVTVTAKCLTIFETILSFVTIIFILSDFMSLKESLIDSKKD